MILSRDQARAFYDRFGAKQDLQRFYEDPAIDVLIEHADFEHAAAVIELGCGTGRLAETLLRTRVPAGATYLGIDISTTMIDLARKRLRPWKDRAEVRIGDDTLGLPAPDASRDRFVSTYVLDLLGEADIEVALREARRVLVPGGRLCLASLTFGRTAWSRAVSGVWRQIHDRHPMWVGGCRPLELVTRLEDWRVLHHEVVCAFGICTEVVVAT